MRADLPDDWTVRVLAPSGQEPLPDVAAAVGRALDAPTGAPPLTQAARGRPCALVVVSDITRPVPNSIILPAVLERLDRAGIRPRAVTVLVATGLHRPPTDEETRAIVGDEALAAGVRVVPHRAREAKEQVALGRTDGGIPVFLDHLYRYTPFRIVIGLVEPHFMAGFSGGPKAICPGLVGQETILAFHGPRLLAHRLSAPGAVDGNPLQVEAWRVAEMAGLPDLCIQVVQDLQRRPVGIFAGGMAEAHAAAIACARKALACSIPAPADVAITSNGGYPLDHVFYQSGKGMAAAAGVVRPGGGVIIAERNEEGLGSEEFARLIAGMGDPIAWEPDPSAGAASEIDEWALQELAKLARHCRIVNVCPDGDAAYRAAIPIPTVDSIEEAIALLRRESIIGDGAAAAAVLPDGPYTLPTVGAADA
jgi:nickel-dependent lactate racemase